MLRLEKRLQEYVGAIMYVLHILTVRRLMSEWPPLTLSPGLRIPRLYFSKGHAGPVTTIALAQFLGRIQWGFRMLIQQLRRFSRPPSGGDPQGTDTAEAMQQCTVLSCLLTPQGRQRRVQAPLHTPGNVPFCLAVPDNI